MKMFFALMLALTCNLASATAQRPDQITVEGLVEPLFTNPFIPFVEQREQFVKLMPFLKGICSSAWLGFTATWEVREQKLYLLKLISNPCSQNPEPIPLNTFFPEATSSVHAAWYTGVLTIPRGKQVEYVHMGYASRYERYLLIEVRQGVVLSQREVSESSLQPKP